jgi:hypothetical protein
MEGEKLPTDAWLSARLGFALDSVIDRVINKPELVYDGNGAYGVNPDGTLYQLGQPNYAAPTARKPVVLGNTGLLLIVVGLVFLASK